MTAGERPYRYSRRWHGFDYQAEYVYFITICTEHRQPLLSEIDLRCKVRLSAAGVEIANTWDSLPGRFPSIRLLGFVAMPDHVHGLVQIMPVPAGGTVATPCSLGNVIGAFKSLSARNANRVLGRRNVSFWQRGYHDRVVRSDDELERLRWYIDENPSRWAAARLLDDA